jgi:hypothetical protein
MNDLAKLIYLEKLIQKYKLDLTGLTVFTEYASGNYLYTGIAASLANAKRIFFYNRSLTLSQIQDATKGFADNPIYFRNIAITNARTGILTSDIITNAGKVRPITATDAMMMKPTAVIALMMSPDQVRESDIVLAELARAGIAVIGTDEAKIGILDSIGFKIAKACFAAGLSVWGDEYAIMASGPISDYICKFFARNNVEYELLPWNNMDLKKLDAIIVAEYYDKGIQIGNNGILTVKQIQDANPFVKVVNISGAVDVNGLQEAGISVFPPMMAEQDHTTLSGDYLSYKVTFELNVASLKAAEIVARARLSGKSKDCAEQEAVLNGPAAAMKIPGR